MRAGDEHRALSVEQFSFGVYNDSEYLEIHGRISKTHQGGLKHRKFAPKTLKIFSLGDRDIVYCFNLYLLLVPPEGPFYCRPSIFKQQPTFTKQIVCKIS